MNTPNPDDEGRRLAVLELQRIKCEIDGHPRRDLIEALADTMQAIEDDDGNGRHVSYYLSLSLATVELLPNLYLAEQPEFDHGATCGPEECRTALPGGCCYDLEVGEAREAPSNDLQPAPEGSV